MLNHTDSSGGSANSVEMEPIGGVAVRANPPQIPEGTAGMQQPLQMREESKGKEEENEIRIKI